MQGVKVVSLASARASSGRGGAGGKLPEVLQRLIYRCPPSVQRSPAPCRGNGGPVDLQRLAGAGDVHRALLQLDAHRLARRALRLERGGAGVVVARRVPEARL